MEVIGQFRALVCFTSREIALHNLGKRLDGLRADVDVAEKQKICCLFQK